MPTNQFLLLLALCKAAWPTPKGVNHNITLGEDMRLELTIFHDGLWSSFAFADDELGDIPGFVAGMKAAIDDDAQGTE